MEYNIVNRIASGQGEIPDWRYSPRTDVIICRFGVIPKPTVIVRMKEAEPLSITDLSVFLFLPEVFLQAYFICEVNMKKDSVKRIAACGMLCAAAYVITVVFRIPVFAAAPFLKIDFKDTVIALGGFIYGPVPAVMIAIITAFAEFLTVSESGFIGFVMNALSSISLSLTASLIYKYRRTISGAATGLISGALTMTAFMLLWNWLITPLYTGMPRSAVAGMLIPIILPFNLLKSFLCASFTLILYRPITSALKRASLLPESHSAPKSSRITAIVTIIGIALASICVLAIVLIKIYG